MKENKVALVTGGTTGIGKAIAQELAKSGFNIAINYRTETEEMQELKKEIEEKIKK